MSDKFARKIFNTKDNKDYVIRLISKILNMEIQNNDFELLPTNIMSNKETKNSQVDVIYLYKNKYINIEINKYEKEEYKRKNITYIAQLILKDTLPNKNYNFKNIYQINIDLYDHYKEGKLIYESVMMDKNIQYKYGLCKKVKV